MMNGWLLGGKSAQSREKGQRGMEVDVYSVIQLEKRPVHYNTIGLSTFVGMSHVFQAATEQHQPRRSTGERERERHVAQQPTTYTTSDRAYNSAARGCVSKPTKCIAIEIRRSKKSAVDPSSSAGPSRLPNSTLRSRMLRLMTTSKAYTSS